MTAAPPWVAALPADYSPAPVTDLHETLTGPAWRAMRIALGVHLAELAELAGVSTKTVRRAEFATLAPPWALAALAAVRRACLTAELEPPPAAVRLHARGWRMLPAGPIPETAYTVVIGRLLAYGHTIEVE